MVGGSRDIVKHAGDDMVIEVDLGDEREEVNEVALSITFEVGGLKIVEKVVVQADVDDNQEQDYGDLLKNGREFDGYDVKKDCSGDIMEEVALEVEFDNLRTALDLETLDDNGAIHVDQNVKDEKGSDEKLSHIGNVLVIEIEGLAKGSHPDDPEVGD